MKPYQLVHTSSQCKKHRGRDHDRASPSVRSSTSRARLAYYSLCTPLAASASTRASSITHVACLMSVPPLSDSRARSPGPRAGRHADAPPAQVPESRPSRRRLQSADALRVEREPRSYDPRTRRTEHRRRPQRAAAAEAHTAVHQHTRSVRDRSIAARALDRSAGSRGPTSMLESLARGDSLGG